MIMLIVAFATSLAMPAVSAESHHDHMVASVAISMHHHGTCTHDGCPIDHQADMHGTCFASGSAASALSPATAASNVTVAQDVFTLSLDRAMVDRAVPPDPHPPKQVELI